GRRQTTYDIMSGSERVLYHFLAEWEGADFGKLADLRGSETEFLAPRWWSRVLTPGGGPVYLLTPCSVVCPAGAWDADLELFDLVEEIPQTFYQFLSLDQIKKAYRRLTLSLHPDKNKDENAESQFRQLVGIYEVLKDEERRQRYDDILVNGVPDWKHPFTLYRRVRKMSNAELGFLLFLILTVGHYAIIWSVYLEKQLDEMDQDRPQWQDILPLKLSIWLYLSIKSLPQAIQEMKMRAKEEEEEQESAPREKRPKVKKMKVEFPVLESPAAPGLYLGQTASIQEVEDQLDDWLDHRKGKKKARALVLVQEPWSWSRSPGPGPGALVLVQEPWSWSLVLVQEPWSWSLVLAPEWSDEDVSLLSRNMVKFPGGTPGRWEKIAQELGRSVADVTTKVKQVKDCVSNTSGLVKLSELKGGQFWSKAPPAGCVADSLMTQRDADGTPPQGEEQEGQNQQKLLETALQTFPRGSAERWDRIARVVPGKGKEECMVRYKLLAELVQKRKQAKS
ncbi:hypothetical protein NHX12_034367, partial [Muraenolepis orangiensis]